MANPREIAEQAFALLQNALSESEARASDLDEQLKRKRAPKNRLEEQLDVLSHRLESVEAERTHWEQQAGHLEEVAEAERVKVAQLKKKLEIAESGPEKLTKKEVNFWRAKAETIDAQITEYQERLAALRRELNERDALIAQLNAAGSQPADERAESPSEPESELRRQLEQRDRWLAELRLELHELRGQPAPPLETQAEVETLRTQIAGLERALAEAHNLRASVQADLSRAEQEIAERERAIREAAAVGERSRATLGEREHRIVELSAEVEHLRNDLRQRDEQQRASAAQHEERLATLTRDAEALRSRMDQDRHDTSTAKASLEKALHEREHELERHRQLVSTNERELAELRRQLAHREQELQKQRQLLSANDGDFAELRRQVAEREQAAHEAHHQVEQLQSQLAEHEQAAQHAQGQIEEHRRAVHERERELVDQQHDLRELSEALAERDQRFTATAAQLEQAQSALAAGSREIESLRETLQSAHHELEQARATLAANERELTSLRNTLGTSHRELAELKVEKERLETTVADVEARAAAAAGDLEAAREQMAGLEAELKEEREHAESLGELANERREHMTKLQEQVEEAEERYAEANWRLGKSLHFERIVKRRKGLVLKLLAALRAKAKANAALKAGIDGLRTYKAATEMTQEKLLKRIDALKAELIEAEESVKRHQGGTAAKEELTNAIARAAALEERLNTQAELIQSLEADLKAARLVHKPADDKSAEIERLAKELATKNEVILKLEADIDEQQRKLAKLRGSESETVRLKAISEKERSEIDALQREIAQLREALARQSSTAAQPAGGNSSELEVRLKEREQSVTRLMGTIKEHESTIKKLTESAEGWKRKYQFLATDSPDAYKSSAEK